MADHLFLDMPSSVALGIVKMQMQLVMAHMTPLLSVPAGQRNELLSTKDTTVNDVPCGNKFRLTNLFGLNNNVSTDSLTWSLLSSDVLFEAICRQPPSITSR
jgi:hypothetical protein